MLKTEFLRFIACPKCKNDIEYDKENNFIICPACRLKYPVKNDIPVMLIKEAESY